MRWWDGKIFESQTYSIHEEISLTEQKVPGGDDQHVYSSRNMLKSDVEKIRGIFGFLVEKYLSSKFYDSLVEYGQLSLGEMHSNGGKCERVRAWQNQTHKQGYSWNNEGISVKSGWASAA